MSGTRSYTDGAHAGGGLAPAPALVTAFRCEGHGLPYQRLSLLAVARVEFARSTEHAIELRVTDDTPTAHFGLVDPWASTPHARLQRLADGTWELSDSSSKNGTRVNGESCETRVLRDGDIFEIGGTFFFFFSEFPTDPRLPPVREVGLHDDIATLSESWRAAVERLDAVAKSSVPVLVLGETGTGKELLAERVHRLSGRRGQFVAVNCASIPEALAESELFGHRRGAFSGAHADKPGLIRAADGGTLFLDELGELSPSIQAKLLRVLQDGRFTPVGETRPQQVDIRVVSATNKDLDGAAAAGEFRQDLLARLAGFCVHVPALRDRECDLGLLFSRLAARHRGDVEGLRVSRAACDALLTHRWPANIRELEQVVRAGFALAGDDALDLAHLPADLIQRDATALQKRQLETLLEKHQGNVSAVARELDKARVQIRRWCQRFQLDPASYRKP